MREPEKELASWTDFGDAISNLTKSISDSDFQPDCIVAIIRGGLILGGTLAHRLGIKDVFTLNVEYYKGVGIDDVQLEAPRVLEPDLDPALLVGRKVLIVDDVADSGVTLRFVTDLLTTATSVRTAVWFAKPHSAFTADFSASVTGKWIVFPWSPFSPFGENQGI